MSHLVLGLDLGPNSIGWALVNDDPENPAESKLIDLGVRVFPEGVDAFDTSKEVSRSEQRRIARGMRRQQRRRAFRRRHLKEALIQLDLWPAEQAVQEELYGLDPYELRARGLDQQLSLHELGRVLLHLNQRRGFRSNKKEQAKADAKAKKKSTEKVEKAKPAAEKKTEDMLLEMAELERAIRKSGARTLGEYLYRKNAALDHKARVDDDIVRGRHTQRKMLMEEFDQIWNTQAGFYPQLNDEHRYGKLGRQKDIHRPIPKNREFLDHEQTVRNPRCGMSDQDAFGLFGLIFFHRALKPVPKEIVGLCELEPKARRCARADRRAQKFRLLQEINNLRYIDPDAKEECSLSDGQRKMLLDHLATREKVTFDDIRKKLGFLETVKFKMEKGNRSSLQGAVTDWLIAKSFGKEWHEIAEETKDEIVSILIASLDEEETRQRLITSFDFSEANADAVMGVELPESYVKLSLLAIQKLLPHMERGMVYMAESAENSALHAAGYFRRDQLQRRLFDKLPDPRRSANSPIGDIPNPVVKRTLTEIRKLVNAILREHGKPDAVHLEMASSLQMSAEKRKDYNKQIRDREAERTKIADELRANNVRPTRENILRYDLLSCLRRNWNFPLWLLA